MLDMAYVDLESARKHYLALRDLIILRSGGWRDEASLRKLEELCRAAVAAVDDAECRERIAAVVQLAAELFSDAEHHKWARNRTKGADIVRLSMLRELDVFHARLLALGS